MNGDTYTTHIPANLSPGDYLVRHEIIALQLATAQGGAEFYPSCSQIRVSGNGTGVPQETVALPGAYSDTDPGILVPTVRSLSYSFASGVLTCGCYLAGVHPGRELHVLPRPEH